MKSAVVAFNVFAQYLCEKMGYTPFLKEYLLWLLPTIGIFGLFYLAALGLYSERWYLKGICWLFVMLILLWTGLMAVTMVDLLDERDGYEDHLHQMATMHLLDLAKPFGKGDPCYQYPDSVLEAYSEEQEDLPKEVERAFDERAEAAFYFENYHDSRMLPVLSYSYGLWVNWVFVILTVLWCTVGAINWLRLYRWWEKIFCLLPYGVVVLQMVYGVLGGFGQSEVWLFYPFSGNWMVNMMFVAPLLGVMFGLIQSSTPAPEPIMEPGDDFWHEIIEED